MGHVCVKTTHADCGQVTKSYSEAGSMEIGGFFLYIFFFGFVQFVKFVIIDGFVMLDVR